MKDIATAMMRLGLLAALLASWCVYALTVRAGSGTATLKAAMAKKGPPPKATTSVSWLNGGKPMDSKTMAGMLEKARAISDEVNARAGEGNIPVEYRTGSPEDPAVVVPQAIALLVAPDADARREGAMTMCDNRFAKWERAGEAIPALEQVVSDKDPDAAEFAALAIKRIRFWQSKRAKP